MNVHVLFYAAIFVHAAPCHIFQHGQHSTDFTLISVVHTYSTRGCVFQH